MPHTLGKIVALRVPRLFKVLALVPVFLPGLLRADTANSAPASPAPPVASAAKVAAIDPKARDYLASVAKYYMGMTSFQVDITSVTKMELTGMKTEMTATYTSGMSRPNSFALINQSGMMGGTVVSDGKKFISYMPILGQYTSAEASDHFGNARNPMTSAVITGGLPLGLMPLLAEDPAKAYLERASKVTFLGPDKVGDEAAQHIRIEQSPYTTDLWFADGASPLLLQTEITMDMAKVQAAMKKLTAQQKVKMPPNMPTNFSSMKMDRLNAFNNWKVDQPLPDSFFTFQPPPGARLVAAFGAAGGISKSGVGGGAVHSSPGMDLGPAPAPASAPEPPDVPPPAPPVAPPPPLTGTD